MHWDIVLTRRTVNKTNYQITTKALKWVAGAATVNKKLGFTARLKKLEEPDTLPAQSADDSVWLYHARIRLEREGDPNLDTVKKALEHVMGRLRKRAEKKGWTVEGQPSVGRAGPSLSHDNHDSHGQQDQQDQAETQDKEMVDPFPPFVLPGLDDEIMRDHFGDIYERDAHIRIVHRAVETSLNSHGKVLSHVLLYGLPGACKTKLMESFKTFYEKDEQGTFERVAFVDGTTMSKAGLEKYLLALAGTGTNKSTNRLPVVLVVDEIEKQPMDNLLCLNNVMGSGVLTRLNAFTGNVRVPAIFTVVGICNDEKMLKDFRNGALWSRFTHKLYCARPSRIIAREILEQIAVDIGCGDHAREMADAALRFGWDQLGQRDIREIKGHLDGREDLLSGLWQKDKLTVYNSEEKLALS